MSSAAASGPRPDELAVHCALHWHGIWDAIASTGQSLSTTKRPQPLPGAAQSASSTHCGSREGVPAHAQGPNQAPRPTPPCVVAAQHRSSSTKRPSVAAPRMPCPTALLSLSVCLSVCLSSSLSVSLHLCWPSERPDQSRQNASQPMALATGPSAFHRSSSSSLQFRRSVMRRVV